MALPVTRADVHTPASSEVEDFTDRVDEVTRLIAGLKDGSLPPEYIDRKEELRQTALEEASKQAQQCETTQVPALQG
jgi:hypothetical protein